MTNPTLNDLTCALTDNDKRRLAKTVVKRMRADLDWCEECKGYTHAPWCSGYEEAKSDDSSPSEPSGVSEAALIPKTSPSEPRDAGIGTLAGSKGSLWADGECVECARERLQ